PQVLELVQDLVEVGGRDLLVEQVRPGADRDAGLGHEREPRERWEGVPIVRVGGGGADNTGRLPTSTPPMGARILLLSPRRAAGAAAGAWATAGVFGRSVLAPTSARGKEKVRPPQRFCATGPGVAAVWNFTRRCASSTPGERTS